MKLNLSIPNDFNGVVYVEKDNNIIFNQCYGYANTTFMIPNQLHTRFPTASAGKVFIATAILQLIEQRQLSFDSTIGEILSFDLHQIDKNITIKQLLNHTSGIPDYFDESLMQDYSQLWKNTPSYNFRRSKDLIPLFINKPMSYQPGTKFQYNNTGYVVLGLIIEEITKKPFDQYINETIFVPCNMNDTGYYELDRLPKNCADAYIYDTNTDSYYTNIFSVEAKGSGAGGAFITVPDIKKYWQHLLQGKLLSKEMLQRMFHIQSNDKTSQYGYGVWLQKDKITNQTFPMFMGSDPGVSFISSYHLEKDLLSIIVSNFENDVWKIHREIQQLTNTNI